MADSTKFRGDLTLAYSCSDMNRTIAWFKDVLGWELIFKVDHVGWCEIATPVKDVSIGFSQVQNPQVKGGPTPTFGVENIAIARKNLEDKGVKFDGPIHEIPNMVKLTTFFDPDGNKLMFVETIGAGMEGQCGASASCG